MGKESFNKIKQLLSSINKKEYQLILNYLEKYRKPSKDSKHSIFTLLFLEVSQNF